MDPRQMERINDRKETYTMSLFSKKLRVFKCRGQHPNAGYVFDFYWYTL